MSLQLEKRALMILFGATGDLAQRKLFPSLYHLFCKGILQEHFAVIGAARSELNTDEFRQIVHDSIADIQLSDESTNEFIRHFEYVTMDVTLDNDYRALRQLADHLDHTYDLRGNRLFYLAMAPRFFGTISDHLKEAGIKSKNGFNRLIIEKPFGHDFQSAKQLNEAISRSFSEEEVFRIDHYLGKEMVQNILALRFGNRIFESLWSNQYIANIQITFAESIGVEDRGGYYDDSGALKDMIQNHVLQVVSLLAMEPPTRLTEQSIREEKIKALKSVRLYQGTEALRNFVRGQYVANTIDDVHYKGYRQEPKVNPRSYTETFVAGRLLIDNFRWSGVPFYVRSGKRLTEKGTQINIIFKPLPINVFQNQESLSPNVLTIYIQPTEGFSLTLNGKEIGSDFGLTPVNLDYRHSSDALGNSPEAYERLISDCLVGDSTNFTHWEEVAQSWRIVDRITNAWTVNPREPDFYPVGSMGPRSSSDLLKRDGFDWFWKPEQKYQNHGIINF